MLGNRKLSPDAAPATTRSNQPVDTIDTLIGQTAVFKGDLEFTGGLRVDGQIKGNVIAKNDSNSTVVVSESGRVEGNIAVPHVVVNGAINGNIKSDGRLELQAKSRINGDVHYKAVEMELGASVNGNLVCEASAGTAGGSANHGAITGRGPSGMREAPTNRSDTGRPAVAKSG